MVRGHRAYPRWRWGAVTGAILTIMAADLHAQSKSSGTLRRFEYQRPAPDALVQPRYVYCAEFSHWAEQEEAREHDPARWADIVRGHFAKGLCRITRGGERLRVVGEADDGPNGHLLAFIAESPDGLLWYVSPEAYPWQ